MRFLLLLLLPGLLSLIGLLLRTWISMRVNERERARVVDVDATVRDARSSPIDSGGDGDTGGGAARVGWRPRRPPPPCGRYNLHLLFRLTGGEASCRHCAAIERDRFEADAAAAVDAAEEALRGGRPRP